jgi:hypothetical protein
MKTKPNTFWLLVIVNHRTKKFDIRIANDKGTLGSGNSLVEYCLWMQKQLARAAAGAIPTPGYAPFWKAVLRDAGTCEQYPLMMLEISDKENQPAAEALAKERMVALFTDRDYTWFGNKSVDD